MKSTVLLLVLCIAYCHAHIDHPLNSLRKHLEGNTELFSELDGSITLDAKPLVLTTPLEWVNVTITGVSNPTAQDLMAVYSPASADPTKTSPLKYKYATYFGKDYVKTGNGVAGFKLINFHSDFKFVLFRNVSGVNFHGDSSLKKFKGIAQSNTVTFKNPKDPNQIHFAFTKNPGELIFTWNAPVSSGQQFQIGSAPGNYKMNINAESRTYTAQQLCGSPANDWGWKNPGYFHSVVVNGLNPRQRYYYRYGSAETGFSAEETFTSPQMNSQTVNFVSFGDLGKFVEDGTDEHWNVAPQSLWTVNHVTKIRDRLDFILHVGDIAYAVGYSSQWDEFFNQIQPISARVPWMTLPGNHESDFPNSGSFFNGTDSGGECGIPYESRFPMPREKKAHWYSFNYGPIHIISFSTEHDFARGTPQYKWMEDDLKKVDRRLTPWVLVAGHRPMYAVGFFAATLRTEIEPLFEKYKVDIALWGHVHNYERTCPMTREKCKAGATTHVVVGMGGYQVSNLTNPYSYIKKNINESGYTKIYASSQFLQFQYLNGQNMIKDEFVLHK